MEKFYFITHDNHNPYFNLASEEYLLKVKGGYYFYLWINNPAVICGINQNSLEEVNLDYVERNDIKVVRRLTGGGAVYHDNGNICYTIIAPYNSEENNYVKFTKPVIDYLSHLGIKAELSGRNDITIDGKKISGTAQTVYKDRIMHHGTLLFDTDTHVLSSALKPNKLKMQSKGIKSVKSRVGNISDFIVGKMTVSEFKKGLEKQFLTMCEPYEFDKNDLDAINGLVENKYSKYEWNFGKSPKGKNSLEKKLSFGIIKLTFDTIDGKIENAHLNGDFFSFKDIEPLVDKLNGTPLKYECIKDALNGVENYIVGATATEIATAFFD